MECGPSHHAAAPNRMHELPVMMRVNEVRNVSSRELPNCDPSRRMRHLPVTWGQSRLTNRVLSHGSQVVRARIDVLLDEARGNKATASQRWALSTRYSRLRLTVNVPSSILQSISLHPCGSLGPED